MLRFEYHEISNTLRVYRHDAGQGSPHSWVGELSPKGKFAMLYTSMSAAELRLIAEKLDELNGETK